MFGFAPQQRIEFIIPILFAILSRPHVEGAIQAVPKMIGIGIVDGLRL